MAYEKYLPLPFPGAATIKIKTTIANAGGIKAFIFEKTELRNNMPRGASVMVAR
jgi:hypothetical protein